jgi:frataxin
MTGVSTILRRPAPSIEKLAGDIMTIDESTFSIVADETLTRLMENLEDAVGDRLDVELQEGVLTIELDSGGQYVINKHAPNRQIWMSSPVSGALHFDYDGDAGWVATRGSGTLAAILSAELSAAIGEIVGLD